MIFRFFISYEMIQREAFHALFDDIAQWSGWYTIFHSGSQFILVGEMVTLIRFRKILQNTSLEAYRSVIPRQLSQFHRSSILAMSSLVQSYGMAFVFSVLPNRPDSTLLLTLIRKFYEHFERSLILSSSLSSLGCAKAALCPQSNSYLSSIG